MRKKVKEVAVIKFGQPATWCYQCRDQTYQKKGEYLCGQAFGKCLYPVPQLTTEETLIMELFRHLQGSWIYVAEGFSRARRVGIPISCVESAARIIGLRLNLHRLTLINAAIQAIVNDDIKRNNEAAS